MRACSSSGNARAAIRAHKRAREAHARTTDLGLDLLVRVLDALEEVLVADLLGEVAVCGKRKVCGICEK